MGKDSVRDIEMRCKEILRSPYSFREVPKELQRLQAVMSSATILASVDVPNLLAEVKSLRAQVTDLQKRLEQAQTASPDTLDPSSVTHAPVLTPSQR